LSPVPSMDLVDKDDRAFAFELKPLPCGFDRFPEVGHARGHGRECFENCLRPLRQYKSNGSFTGSWRTPEDNRVKRAARGHLVQELAGGQKMLLANHLFETPRAHPVRQGLPGRRMKLEKALLVINFAPCHG